MHTEPVQVKLLLHLPVAALSAYPLVQTVQVLPLH